MRKYISTIIIVAMGAGIAWWSSHTSSSVASHVQEEVIKLVPRFQSDPSTIRSLLIDPILEPILASSLTYLYEESLRHHAYNVVVTRGDNEEFGDGTATHVAMFQIDEKPVTGLRIICESDTDPLRIAGVFSGTARDSVVLKADTP